MTVNKQTNELAIKRANKRANKTNKQEVVTERYRN